MFTKLIISIALTLAVLAFPTRLLELSSNGEAVFKIVKGLVFITLLSILMHREKFLRREKIGRHIPGKIFLMLTPVIVLIAAYIAYAWNKNEMNFNGSTGFFLLTLMGTFIAASGEEVVFRGYIFNLFKKYDYSFLKSILLTSLLFSLAHTANSFRVDDVWSILNQLIFSFALGLLLGSIFALTNNLLLVCVLHFLINIPSTLQRISNVSASDVTTADPTFSEEILSTLFFIMLMLPVLALAIYYLRIARKNDSALTDHDNLRGNFRGIV